MVEERVSAERQWGEDEALALLSVWDEVGAEHVAESRATFELISERLRRLSVVRSWWECQAKCRSLGLQQSRKRDAAAAAAAAAGGGASASYNTGVEGGPKDVWQEEAREEPSHTAIHGSVTVPGQEGKQLLLYTTEC